MPQLSIALKTERSQPHQLPLVRSGNAGPDLRRGFPGRRLGQRLNGEHRDLNVQVDAVEQRA